MRRPLAAKFHRVSHDFFEYQEFTFIRQKCARIAQARRVRGEGGKMGRPYLSYPKERNRRQIFNMDSRQVDQCMILMDILDSGVRDVVRAVCCLLCRCGERERPADVRGVPRKPVSAGPGETPGRP